MPVNLLGEFSKFSKFSKFSECEVGSGRTD